MTGRALSGSVSSTLGAADPRNRRNHQAELAESDVRIDASLELDDRQRLRIKGAADPGSPPTDTVANLADYVTSLVNELRNAGLIRSE